jgi:hypothetical protein
MVRRLLLVACGLRKPAATSPIRRCAKHFQSLLDQAPARS